MTDQPLVSIVMPTHDRPLRLARALQSVTNQTFADQVEIVLVADEGTMETRETAIRYLRPTDRFLSLPGMRGPSATRNIGMSVARGQWIAFLDDDDSIDPDYIEQVAPHLAANPGKVVYTNFTKLAEVEEDGGPVITGRDPRQRRARMINRLAVQNFIHMGGFFTPADIARQGQFDPLLPSHEDWEYLLQLRKLTDFVFADVWGANYHRPQTATRNKMTRAAMRQDYLTIYQRHRVDDAGIRQQRADRLKQWGLTIDPDSL